MDFQRPLLIAAIAAVSFMLLLEWNKFQQAQQPVNSVAQQQIAQQQISQQQSATVTDGLVSPTGNSGDAPALPAADNGVPSVQGAAEATATSNAQIVDVYTDKLHVKIDTNGGDIVMAALRAYPAKIDTPDDPFVLLTRTREQLYIAQSGLIGNNGTDSSGQRPQFRVAQNRYDLPDGQQQLQVDLLLEPGNGVAITKRYTFTRGEHVLRVSYLVQNGSDQPWSAHLYGQIKRDTHQPPSTGAIGMMPFLGMATNTTEQNYHKQNFDDLIKEPLKTAVQGGWIAMVQHYFISAWIPQATDKNSFYTSYQQNSDTHLLGFTGPQVDVAPGGQAELSADFYAGPKDVYRLEKLAPYLDLTVDYGALWWIAKPLFSLTHFIHSLLGNWGLAIIGLTLVVKGIFLWPSTLSYKSMAVMKKLAPKMQEMRDSYADNPNKLREEMFKLYQKEGANPMLGCLPMLIQTPVFIALYWSLMESVDLRQAPFVGWIVDLSVMDPFFALPLLMGASMWVQQKLNPPAGDPMQQRIFQFMPIMFTAMFLFLPSGLVLYMLVNNLISMAHQFWVYGVMEKKAMGKA